MALPLDDIGTFRAFITLLDNEIDEARGEIGLLRDKRRRARAMQAVRDALSPAEEKLLEDVLTLPPAVDITPEVNAVQARIDALQKARAAVEAQLG
jgi:hypothetical protein